MLRIIVSVLAAFVGFSFGHSIPKWMESKSKSGTGMQSPSLCEPSHHARKHSFRRKSLRKFKFGLQKPGKESDVELDRSLQKLCNVDDDAEVNVSPHEDTKCVENTPLRLHRRLRKEHNKLKFGSERLLKEKLRDTRSNQGLAVSAACNPPCATELDHECESHKLDVYTSSNNARLQQAEKFADTETSRHRACQQVPSSQLHAICIPHKHAQAKEAPRNDDSVPIEQDACKSSSKQSVCSSPMEEKSQMKQWKMKLMNLRSKAMASEKVWYQKFDNESCGGKLSLSTTKKPIMETKKTAKGKENESPNPMSTKKNFWSRSSSRVGLLVEGTKTAFER